MPRSSRIPKAGGYIDGAGRTDSPGPRAGIPRAGFAIWAAGVRRAIGVAWIAGSRRRVARAPWVACARRVIVAAWVAGAGLASIACAAEPTAQVVVDDDPGLPPTPTYTATEEAFAANVNPLSGLPSDTPDIAARHPQAFAVVARPSEAGGQPSGVQTAELVFWSLLAPAPGAAGAPTDTLRLTALTLEPAGARAAIGPLGDADMATVEVARGFGARVMAAAAAEPVAAALDAGGIPLTLGADGVGADVRDAAGGGSSPGSSSGGTPAAGLPPEPPRWGYSETPLGKLDQPAETVTVAPPNGPAVVVRLDRVLGVWRLSRRIAADGAGAGSGGGGDTTGDVALVDAATGEPLAVANVVVLTLAAPGPATGDVGWRGEGPALVLRDGVAQSGRWLRGSPDQPFGLIDADGLAVALRPGNTWVVLAPAGTGVEVDDGGLVPDGGS